MVAHQRKKMRHIWMKKKVLDVLLLLLTGKGGGIAKQAVDDGICDFSGQGRDCYGK